MFRFCATITDDEQGLVVRSRPVIRQGRVVNDGDGGIGDDAIFIALRTSEFVGHWLVSYLVGAVAPASQRGLPTAALGDHIDVLG